ncbi:MAG: NUDIX hydrolase [Ignavibacteria bacterium]|jgi:8-oxo-dGTP pyrophosphatase MutT (NUDIX family)
MIEQAAVIPFRNCGSEIEVMLITSRNKQHWILPKGIVEKGETHVDSAEKEALEEAGIIGKIYEQPVGSYVYKKMDTLCNVEVFPFKVEKIMQQWLEDNFRRRMWFDIDTAITYVNKKEIKKLLKKFFKNKEKFI